MVFCNYCCKAFRRHRVKRHGEQLHGLPVKPLCYGEQPTESLYSNWQEVVMDYGNVVPVLAISSLGGKRKRKTQ